MLKQSLSLMAALGLVACASSSPTAATASVAPPPVAPSFALAVGDTVEVVFHTAPELNRSAEITSDGLVRLPLIAPEPAAGLTPEALASALRTRYSEQLVEPDLDVLVTATEPASVFVGGEVGRPGTVPLSVVRSPLEAVLAAGGFSQTAQKRDVVILRRSETGDVDMYPYDLSEFSAGEFPRPPFPLQRFDIVYVPASRIADQNRFVEQFIRRALPVNFLLFYGITD